MTGKTTGPESPAQRFGQIADRLESKAEWARKRAANHAAGDAGESRLGAAVASLVANGWLALHNRARPHGGNIDHILVGPSGVYVLDSKAWTGPITISGGVLRTNGRNQSRALAAVADQASEVRDTITRAGHPAEVACGLVFTGTDPGPATAERVDGVTVCGLGSLVDSILSRGATFTAEEIHSLTRSIAETFPPYGLAPAAAAETVLAGHQTASEPSSGFLTCAKWLYVEPWSKAGRRRLYLTDSNGEELGWKNLADGTITLTYERGQRLSRAVLVAASGQGLNLPKENVPKVPVDLPGGSFVSALTRTYMTLHIGRRWRRRQLDRMYCTAADPTDGVYDLGWVDLVTGELHPSHVTLPKHWSPAEQRLRWMLDRRPVTG